ncbi:MAG: Glutamate-semialdehyde -aminomutase [Acidimicrobiales bacterium]|nr:Glutamate-semialdehyde -aminomutase [Acidimicrobiales bacterium]
MHTANDNTAWHNRAAAHTPGGVHSNARLVGAETVLVRGEGPWLWDVEGNRYADYMLGRGPAYLGHSPANILEAVNAASANGMCLGSATQLEIEASEAMLSVVPWADQVRFTSSGTEAVQSALRLARAATGRSTVIQFEGQYHGWVDGVSLIAGPSVDRPLPATKGQAPSSYSDTVLLPWNDLPLLERIFTERGDTIAAVIMEPVNIFGGVMPADGYLAGVRELTRRHGTVLIFDEVVTGFRLAPGSAADLLGVTPDLGTYAKAMGSGWPVSAIAGASWLFDGVASDQVRLSGTYNGNSAAMAAVIATIEATRGGAVHAAVDEYGTALATRLVAKAAEHGIAVRNEGYPAGFWLSFDSLSAADSQQAGFEVAKALRGRGVIMYRRTWLSSAAHDAETMDFTVDAFDRALSDWSHG